MTQAQFSEAMSLITRRDREEMTQAQFSEAMSLIKPIPKRPDWNLYFMQIAHDVATRATCSRKYVGAVIAVNNRIVSTGYNGAPAGLPHCDDVGHLMKEIDSRPSCIRTLHAESNALDDAGREARGGTLYVTVIPCYPCAMRIINAGLARVVYGEYYESQNTPLVESLFAEAGIELVQYETQT